jgi:hypothetical protein
LTPFEILGFFFSQFFRGSPQFASLNFQRSIAIIPNQQGPPMSLATSKVQHPTFHLVKYHG